MRISDWSSDVCSSDLQVLGTPVGLAQQRGTRIDRPELLHPMAVVWEVPAGTASDLKHAASGKRNEPLADSSQLDVLHRQIEQRRKQRSEEHTSELQSLMRISYAVFCLTKKQKRSHKRTTI